MRRHKPWLTSAMQHSHEELRALLNGQTGQIPWSELQRHYARGVVIRVAPDMDLIEVAARVVEDDKDAVAGWMAQGKVANAESEDARRWNEQGSVLWAVVAAPWVLVQEPER
jgi:hypothetical protein